MMNEWWLLTGCSLLLMIAVGVVLYPLRAAPRVFFLAPVLILLISLAYWHWGSVGEWIHYLQTREKQQHIQQMLKSMQGPSALIEQLKQAVKEQPNRAKGWYLLGRLYVSQNQWQLADDAFTKAYQLEPDNEQFTLNYVQNAWQMNQQKFTDTHRKLLAHVLEKNPNQPDALAMLAMDAYQ